MTESDELLVPHEEYLKAGVHIGTKFKTNYMENFIYKTRPDGLNVLNIEIIDKRIRILAKFLAQYDPEDVIIISRRENGWQPLEKMEEMTDIHIVPGRYPPGILTNPNLDDFIEVEAMLVTDPWPDRNAVKDALKMGIVVAALCDSNNEANKLDLCIPCNNKGKKSLALVLYLLTREYLKERGEIDSDDEFDASVEDFLGEE